jgi:hypothetical protein
MNPAYDSTNYYLERKDKYWEQLERMMRSTKNILPKYLDSTPPEQIVMDTRVEFEDLLGELPYIGGDKNILTFTFVSGTLALAFIRVLERTGLSVEVIGRLINEIYQDVFDSLPSLVKWYLRWSDFSTGNQKKLKSFATESQLRQYPENWVMEYVEGDGENYDYGCNYTECAVLKFYLKKGAAEYMPYVCVADFGMSRALRTGLTRTQTIQYGGACCDFRFKKNHLGLSPLPLEGLPEFQNRVG